MKNGVSAVFHLHVLLRMALLCYAIQTLTALQWLADGEAAPAEPKISDVSLLVGKILSVEDHPEADE